MDLEEKVQLASEKSLYPKEIIIIFQCHVPNWATNPILL